MENTGRIPTYVNRLSPDEAFILLQLVDSAQILGKDAEKIAKLRSKLSRVLNTHAEKTGEYVGYLPQESSMSNGGAI